MRLLRAFDGAICLSAEKFCYIGFEENGHQWVERWERCASPCKKCGSARAWQLSDPVPQSTEPRIICLHCGETYLPNGAVALEEPFDQKRILLISRRDPA